MASRGGENRLPNPLQDGFVKIRGTLAAACVPLIFTQQLPLTSQEIAGIGARQRGISADEDLLRELWRVGLLAPFFEIRSRRLAPAFDAVLDLSGNSSSVLAEIRRARGKGRLIDPESLGYRPQFHFHRPSTQRLPNWWNGLIYARWQVLALTEFEPNIANGRRSWRDGALRWRLQDPTPADLSQAVWYRRLATLLVALDGRYLPEIEDHVTHLVSVDRDEWSAFKDRFSPSAVLTLLDWSSDDLVDAASRLLARADYEDPVGPKWSLLLRRAPRTAREDLSGDVGRAMDARLAAEILLRCYEDLSDRGQVIPLGDRNFTSEQKRLTYRADSLDKLLTELGLSPHPGVILVVEGETEGELVPRVQDWLQMDSKVELIRPIVLRGVSQRLTKLAAFACAPFIERVQGDYWLLRRPPTRLMVLVDPEGSYHTPELVVNERVKLVDEIRSVVRAQGVDPTRDEIDSLVEIHTWKESCFEFEHFSDRELQGALTALHPNCNGMAPDALEHAISLHRSNRGNIDRVWANWQPQPSKVELAHALWPTLRAKLESASKSQGQWPPVAERISEAFAKSALRHRGLFRITGTVWPNGTRQTTN